MKEFTQKEMICVENPNDADLITHNGNFHSDEVFCTVILSTILEKETIKICRIFDITNNSDAIVYDIGGGKYDHHQFGGNGQRENGIMYSSFGLIWRDFGKDFLKKIEVQNIDDVWKAIDRKVVQTIDAVDNGQLKKLSEYDFEILTIPNLISIFNSKWDEEENQNEYFIQAVKFAKDLLYRIIVGENSKTKAKTQIEEAIEKTNNQILILDKFMPWKEFLLDSQNPKAKEILYVIFPSNRGGYNICSVPKEKGSFESRKLFPKEWAGLKDNELQKITGIKTATFCHNGRFVCCTKTKDDAIKIAENSIKNKGE